MMKSKVFVQNQVINYHFKIIRYYATVIISFWQNETLVVYVYIFRQTMGDLQTCLILSVEKFQQNSLQYYQKGH
jgi:hypothetical protein